MSNLCDPLIAAYEEAKANLKKVQRRYDNQKRAYEKLKASKELKCSKNTPSPLFPKGDAKSIDCLGSEASLYIAEGFLAATQNALDSVKEKLQQAKINKNKCQNNHKRFFNN